MRISDLPAKPLAFFVRDLLIASSYRLQFLLQAGGIFVSTVMFYFLSRLVGPGVAGQLQPYGGDYFAFVLVGVAFAQYLSVAMSSFTSQIREAQVMGTLEALLVTPTPVSRILLYSSLYEFGFTTLHILVYLLFGALLFGLQFQLGSPAALLLVMALTILAFMSIGLISAAFVIAFKQGSPLNMIVGVASSLLGGVLYPTSVLPGWLERVAWLLPITHSLEAIRQLLLKGASLAAVSGSLLALGAFVAVLLPAGLAAFGAALSHARREGSLIHV